MAPLASLSTLVALALLVGSSVAKQPNILYILSDDVGWNEVSWHNPDMITPNLQELADTGVVLEHHYTNSLCTPSRSALMTGYYAHKLGRQVRLLFVCFFVVGDLFIWLKDLGYNTHIVGKDALVCNGPYTPTYRGSKTFSKKKRSTDKTLLHTISRSLLICYLPPGGFDMRDGERVAWEANGTYSMYLFADKAIEVIESYNGREDPFFLYLATQNVHVPLEASFRNLNITDMYPDETDENRRRLIAMVTAMDEGVGRVIQALKDNGLYDDTIIVWTTDNGGREYKDNNKPLRGYKGSLFEGATRVPAVIRTPLLESTPRVYDGLMHIVDWQDTLLAAIGASEVAGDDGVNQWEALRSPAASSPSFESPRTEFFYNMDFVPGVGIDGGIRVGKYKYMRGLMLYTNETGPWLFNLEDDPNETTNLLEFEPDIAQELQARLEAELENVVQADSILPSFNSNPANWGGAWSPGWCNAS
ncbi:arylsulfatase I-like [Penaeus monodon]|uniref:arylsulfatase I-like n=1 Tax=Penaeus monodon TaxID=6687 RepID=UPI0018A7457A|nr:arylsulfatase I-like [Penaeus monodon]